MIHISALPEDMNDDNGFTSPFNSALNKYVNSKNNNFAALSQETNYYQSASETKPQNRFTGVKKSKSFELRSSCAVQRRRSWAVRLSAAVGLQVWQPQAECYRHQKQLQHRRHVQRNPALLQP